MLGHDDDSQDLNSSDEGCCKNEYHMPSKYLSFHFCDNFDLIH
jgi:hypothetical protein